jgi:hypothetical protein
MKQYVIDQLRESDYEKIRKYLDRNTEKTAIEGIYWVYLPERLYSIIQSEHTSCQKHYFAVSLTLRDVSFELLIRSPQIIRCSCIGYATPQQRDFILNFGDRMLEELDIRL